jgi:xanthine dehydrogenase YagT iron-sulfur-binding subunit
VAFRFVACPAFCYIRLIKRYIPILASCINMRKGRCLVSRTKVLPDQPAPKAEVSRRGFMRGLSLGSGAVGVGLLETEAPAAAQTAAPVVGPGPVPITLQINGKPYKLSLEPRVTLLDALREQLDLTGAKRICDRGTCGSCTVLLDGKAVYSCSVLAVAAQGKEIQTIESLTADGKADPLVTAFVNHDAQQCGFCTPGFVMAAKGFLSRNARPTYEQVKQGLGGNFCRCGTYMGIRKAVLEAAGQMKGGPGNA